MPMKFLLGQVPTDFSLDIYTLITYSWRSKKALFTHCSLEISDKFRKKLSKGLCMPLCGNIFTSWKSFL